jgi:hypothetical protein
MIASATAPPTIVGTNSKKAPPCPRPSKYSRDVTPMAGLDTLTGAIGYSRVVDLEAYAGQLRAVRCR